MTVDPQQLEDFRAKLPAHLQQEYFQFMHVRFDIVVARFLIQSHQIPLHKISVPAWCEALGMTAPRGNHQFLYNGVTDEQALAGNIILTYPLILLEYQYQPNTTGLLLIDGNKRLRKAFLTDIPELDAHILPQEFQKNIQNRERSNGGTNEHHASSNPNRRHRTPTHDASPLPA